MKFNKIEYHQMTSTFSYDIDDEDIIEEFGSVERFQDILYSMSDTSPVEPDEEVTDDEQDLFWEFVSSYDYDRDDDLWTDRKGGYDVDFEIEED